MPGVLRERGVLLLGDPEERLVGKEHDDEFRRRRELPPVRLRRELGHVVSHLAGDASRARSPALLAFGLEGVRYAASGAFASTTTFLPPGSFDDRSGRRSAPSLSRPRPATRSRSARASRDLDDPLQLHLAPPSANVRGAKGRDEVPGPRAQLLLPVSKCAELLPERAVRLLPRLLERTNVAVDLLERLLQRADVALELRLGELEEGAVVLTKRVRRECGELLLEVGARAVGGRELLFGRAPLELDRRFGGLEVRAQHEPGCSAADDEPECEPGQGHGRRTVERRSDGAALVPSPPLWPGKPGRRLRRGAYRPRRRGRTSVTGEASG